MVSGFARRYPQSSLVASCAVLALCYALWRTYGADPAALPVWSGVAFLIAGLLYVVPMISALGLERRHRQDPPLAWLRHALLFGYLFFLGQVIVLGIPLPSPGALGPLFGGIVFGLLMASVDTARDDAFGQMFDIYRPVWTTGTGHWMLLLWPFWLWAVALFVIMVDLGSTRFSVFLLILHSGPMTSFAMRNQTRWRKIDLVGVLALACLMFGLFAPEQF